MTVLDVLNRHATDIGADLRLVQGAGGNLSGKDGDLVWVKASGTRLGRAERAPVFIGVDQQRARSEVLETEDLRHLVTELPEGAPPRPSIETALHVLLPHTYVFHVHSTGSLAAAVQADPTDVLHRLGEVVPTVWVPYAKPGIGLARAVLDAVGTAVGDDELVLLLANHGLVTAAHDADRARALIDDVEAHLRTGTEPAADGGAREQLLPAGTVAAPVSRVLTGGVLTPDEAVFLGVVPFGTAADGPSPAVVTPDGALLVREDLTADARDLVLSLVHVAAHLPEGAAVRYLTDDEVAELVDWEAEKWRIGLAAR